jgi:cysteine-rich repeat protein
VGGADSGGSSGASGGSGSSGDAGVGGAESGPPTLFGVCDKLGALACEEQASAQRLACDGTKWQAGTTCASDELCDSTDGSCKSIVTECAQAKPGDVVCRVGDIPLTCGPDLVTASVGAACDGVCSAGVCVAATCGDDKLQSNEECDDGNTVATDACTATCKKAVCGDGAIWSGHEQCDDKNTAPGDGCSKLCAWEPVTVASFDHSCAVGANGSVRCWGYNGHGALGLGDTVDRGSAVNQMGASLPAVQIDSNHKAQTVAVGQSFSCALLEGGSVKCWGHNEDGELGQGTSDDRGDDAGEMGDNLKAVDLGPSHTARAIGAGNFHACALLDDNTVKCWGYNAYGQLGLGHTHSIGDQPGELGAALPAVPLGSNRFAKAIALGRFHTCALLDDASVKCWGSNESGELGNDDTHNLGDQVDELGDNLKPVDLGAGHGAHAITAGDSFTCALLDDATVKCWGDNSYGELGLGDLTARGLPTGPLELGTGRSAQSIAAGAHAVCAILDDNTVKCWGEGPLGVGDSYTYGDEAKEMGDYLPVVDLGQNAHATQITVGQSYMCAFLNSGVIKCWGLNGEGELGLGSRLTVGDAAGEMGDKLPAVNLVF